MAPTKGLSLRARVFELDDKLQGAHGRVLPSRAFQADLINHLIAECNDQ